MTDRIKGITVVIGGDVSPLSAAMKKVNGEISKTQTELKDINRLLKVDPGNMTLLGQKTSLLGHEIDVTKNKLKALQQAEKQVQRQFKEGKISQEEYRGLQREIIATQQKLKGLELEAAKSNKVIAGISATTEKIGKSAQKAGNALMPVSAAAAAAGVSSVKMADDFEQGLAKISTIADTSQMSMKDLKSGIIDLSNQTGKSVTDLSEGLYQAISSGIQTGDTLQFMGTASKAAIGGFTDTETAVDGLTTVLNSYGMKATEVSKIANQMMVAQNLGKTTFGEIAQEVGNAIPTFASANISSKEFFSSLAVLTSNGLHTQEAVTGLKTALSNIIKPSDAAANAAAAIGLKFGESELKSKGWMGFLQEVKSKLKEVAPAYAAAADRVSDIQSKLTSATASTNAHTNKVKQLREELTKAKQTAAALKKAGGPNYEAAKKKVSDLTAAIKSETAAGTSNKGTIQGLKTELKGAKKEMNALEKASNGQLSSFAEMFGSVQGLNAVLALTSDQGAALYSESMKEMGSNTDYVSQAFDKMEDTSGTKLKNSLNELKNAAIRIGDALAPAIEALSKIISTVAKGIQSIPPQISSTVLVIVAAIGPVLTIIGKVSQAISAFTGGPLAKLLKKNIALADSAKAMGKAFSGITGKDLAPQLDSKRKAKKVLKEQEPEVSAPKVKNSKGTSQSAKKTARDIDTELSKAGKKAGTQVQKNVEALAARIKAGGKPAIAAAKSVSDKIDKALGTAGKNAGSKASAEVENMETKIKEAGKSPKNAAKEVMDGIDDNLSGGKGGKKAGTGIVKSVSELGGKITGAGGTAVNSAGKLSKDIERGLSSGGGKKVGAEVVDAVKKLGPEITSSGLPAITSAGGLSKNINSKLSGSGEGIGGKLLSGVKSLGGKITSSGAGAAASAEGLSKNISGKLSGGSGEIGGRLLSGIKSLGGKITSSGAGAVAATGGITTKISGLFSSLGSGLTAKVPGIAGAFGRIGGAFKALGVTMMANPFTIVIAAIAGLAVALVTAYNKCAWFRDAVNGIWNGIKSVASTVWNGIAGVIGGAANGIKSLISGDFNGARTAATNAMSTLRSAAGTIFGGIKSTIGNAANGAKNLAVSAFQSLNNATGGKLGNLGSIVSKGISSAFSGFRSLGGNMFKWGSEAIGNLVKGIQSMIGNVGNAVKSVGDKIRSFLHFSRPDEGPLRDIDTWMPDMMSKLSGGITGNQGMIQKAVAGVAKSMVIDPAILNPKATVNAQVSTAAVAAGTESGSNMGTGIKFENVQFNLPNVREPKDFAPSLLQQLGQEWVGRKAAYARTGK